MSHRTHDACNRASLLIQDILYHQGVCMEHFLAISDLSSGEVQELLDLAIKLKEEYFKKGTPPYFRGKVLGMIFQKPSLRTRVSFDMAMRHCGGDALYLSTDEI